MDQHKVIKEIIRRMKDEGQLHLWPNNSKLDGKRNQGEIIVDNIFTKDIIYVLRCAIF